MTGETELPPRCLEQALRRMFAHKANKLYLATICPNAPTFVGAFALYQSSFEACELFQPGRSSRQLDVITKNGSRKMNTMRILSMRMHIPAILQQLLLRNLRVFSTYPCKEPW